jgi:ribonuclease P protein component
MLQKENRLRKMKDFEILMKEGNFVGGDLANIKVWWVDPDKYPRREYKKKNLLVGFAVGKKVYKGAVKRNRIKRQMREVVRLLLKDNKMKSGAMVLIIAKGDIVDAAYEEIEVSIVNTLKKARLFCD